MRDLDGAKRAIEGNLAPGSLPHRRSACPLLFLLSEIQRKGGWEEAEEAADRAPGEHQPGWYFLPGQS